MKKTSTSLFALLMAASSLTGLTSMAQTTTGKVNGHVGDDANHAVEAATITLLHAKDSSLVRSAVTDKSGDYSFENVRPGKYLIAASAVGHTRSWSTVFELTTASSSRTLSALVLAAASKNLQEIAVVGKKPLFEQKADRMVVNVDASPANAGSTAMDVLERSPGITVDKDDNISLKGKQGVTVMIDNKPTYMNASQLASYLKGLPSSTIDQIEIMTNPSSKYDASGNSGIINIKTKKNKMRGFNGSLTASHSQGVYGKPSGSLNLNYRTGKANIFFNGGAAQWNGFHGLDIGRTYYNADAGHAVNSIFNQTTNMKNKNPEFNTKLGMDYYLTQKTTIGFVLSGFLNQENTTTTSDIQLKDPHNVLDSIVHSAGDMRQHYKNGSVNLNFRHQFDSTGRELTADLDYIHYSQTNKQFFDNISYYPDMSFKSQSQLRGDLPGSTDIYTFKTDYTRPISSNLKWEAGLKTSYVQTDNIANYFNVVNGADQVDTAKTNHFKYKENINAAYLNLNRQWKKLSVQAGLRFENTNYSGHQLGNTQSVISHDSSFKRSYASLFPTLYISYQANEKNSFSVNYGRRIDRPSYQDLNPFLFFLDQYTYQAGNPYLQPQFTDNVELSHTYGGFLTTTLNYSYTKNFMNETFEQSGRATIVRSGNIGKRQNVGLAVSANVPVTKLWTVIVYANGFYNKFQGVLYGENINVGAWTGMFNLNNQFSFGKGWNGELSGWYRTPGVEGQVIIDGFGAANAAISKKILKDKGTIKVGIRDIFLSQVPKGHIEFQQTAATFRNYRDSRQVSFTFIYRFGKPLKGGPGRRSHDGAGDEQSRVKAGGNSN